MNLRRVAYEEWKLIALGTDKVALKTKAGLKAT